MKTQSQPIEIECPECKRSKPVNGDGTLRKHTRWGEAAENYRSVSCVGSGWRPSPEAVAAAVRARKAVPIRQNLHQMTMRLESAKAERARAEGDVVCLMASVEKLTAELAAVEGVAS